MLGDDPFDVWNDLRGADEGRADGGGAPPAVPVPPGAGNVTQRPLPDPFVDNLGIEYWIWNGSRLVPAWPDEVERIHAEEQGLLERANAARETRAQRHMSARIRTVAARFWKPCAHWLGIPPALLPPEPSHRRKRAGSTGE
jgi:hypothetical protein